MHSQQESMKNLDNQIEQLAKALNNKSLGKLPSDTQVPRLENGKDCNVVELRSRKELPLYSSHNGR